MAVALKLGGKPLSTARVEAIHNPFTQDVVDEVCVASSEHMARALEIAGKGFRVMAKLATHRRVDILQRAATLLEAQSDRFAELIVAESGKPVTYARGEVGRAVMTLRLGAAAALQSRGYSMPIDIEPRAEDRICYVSRVPRGPVGAISPFNFPLNLAVHKLSPAIAVGASVLLKPPHQCPLTALRFGDLLLDAGLPEEGLSVIHCYPEVAEEMVMSHQLKVLSFTGSDRVGWKLKGLAGKKQVLLELGGNAPCIIDRDVDIAKIMQSLMVGCWAHAGQVCIKVQRLIVHESLYDHFMDQFLKATAEVQAGDPADAKTVVGPLIDKNQVARVLQWVEEAVTGGAKMHCGGGASGNVLSPIVLTHVPRGERVYREEVFGPVTVVETFKNFSEALRLANDSRYGLQVGVYTNILSHAQAAMSELEYGGVLINDLPTFRVDNFPYGGTKDSGFGREGVEFAMQEMTEERVCLMRSL